jgi:hypothetical protein
MARLRLCLLTHNKKRSNTLVQEARIMVAENFEHFLDPSSRLKHFTVCVHESSTPATSEKIQNSY